MAESEQSITPSKNSDRPLPKKKHLRFERELIGMMKNKRTCEDLKRILAPLIQEMVQEELKRQSASSVPRSPVNPIQAPDAICAQLHFKNVFSHTFFIDTYIAPIDIVIRRGDSGETIATGAEEFKDKVVSPRKNKGNLLIGTKEITLKSGSVLLMTSNLQISLVRQQAVDVSGPGSKFCKAMTFKTE